MSTFRARGTIAARCHHPPWVKNERDADMTRCPLLPQKRTRIASASVSAKDHRRTYAKPAHSLGQNRATRVFRSICEVV